MEHDPKQDAYDEPLIIVGIAPNVIHMPDKYGPLVPVPAVYIVDNNQHPLNDRPLVYPGDTVWMNRFKP